VYQPDAERSSGIHSIRSCETPDLSNPTDILGAAQRHDVEVPRNLQPRTGRCRSIRRWSSLAGSQIRCSSRRDRRKVAQRAGAGIRTQGIPFVVPGYRSSSRQGQNEKTHLVPPYRFAAQHGGTIWSAAAVTPLWLATGSPVTRRDRIPYDPKRCRCHRTPCVRS
jgi:hypothetical protein